MGINEIIQVGTRIKALRKQRGITQKEMANMLNIPYSTYSNYENNNREPGIEQLQKIADALNIQLYDLISKGYSADTPPEISPEHPIAFPGLEKKVSEIGYSIGYGCDYVETDDDDIWINYPEGKQVHITLQELENLDAQTDSYLKFLLEELRKKKR